MWNLDEAVDWRRKGSLILVKDCVEAKGSFILHHLLSRLLGSRGKAQDQSGGVKVVLVGLADTFSHYNRVARKHGCNLAALKDSGAFVFLQFGPDKYLECAKDVNAVKNPLSRLYGMIRQNVRQGNFEHVCLVIDDASLLEVATAGSHYQVLDFLHYCRALSCRDQGCSLVVLVHHDIYDESDPLSLVQGLESVSDVVLNLEPSNNNVTTDIRGLLTVIHRMEATNKKWPSAEPTKRVETVRFQLLESSVSYSLL